MNSVISLLVAFVYVGALPAVIAYLILRHDPCRSCGGVMIHRSTCTGHFDA